MRKATLLSILVLSAATLFGQPVDSLIAHYDGTVEWDDANATVTFTGSGTIYFPDKVDGGGNLEDDQKQNFWEVPKLVSRIVINAEVTVTGAFHTFASCTIEGEDRKTSVVYGTGLQKWADQNNPGGLDLKEWYYAQFQNFGGVLTVRNLTCLNPYSYFIRGWGTVNHLKSVDFIDNRGGGGNHSDGFSGGSGSTIDDCYFETGDDAIKCYFDITVTNTTIKMIQNCVPFQFGWSGTGYQDSHSVLRNISIIGNDGRWPGNPVFQWKGGGDHKTVEMTGCDIRNPDACLFDLEQASGILDINITNSYIDVEAYKEQLEAGGTRYICGTTEELNKYDCRVDALAIPALVEAEAYSNMSGIETEATSDTSGTENITGIDAGDWLEYELDVQAGGDYTIDFRVASGSEDIRFSLMLGDTELAAIENPPTGSPQQWQTVSATAELPVGVRSVFIIASGGGWKLNWIDFKKNPVLPNVEGLNVRVGGPEKMVLNWTENIDGESGFIIERKETGKGSFFPLDTTVANELSYVDTLDLKEFTLYSYRVRTLYGEAVSQASDSLLGRPPLSAHAALPEPWHNISLGDTLVAMASTASYDNGTFTFDAGDQDFWDTTDRGHFVYQVLSGDCEIVAKLDQYTHAQAFTMAGVMIRDSIDWGSKYVSMFMMSEPGPILRDRILTNGEVNQQPYGSTGEKAPMWLRLKRVGDLFTGFISPDRIGWQSIRSVSNPLGPQVYIGMAATSHTKESPAVFTFSDVVVGDPLDEFTINASAGPNGSISPSGSKLVLRGTTLEYSITPDEGYEILKVELDGDSIGNMDHLVLPDIRAGHTLRATFGRIVSMDPRKDAVALKVYPVPASGSIFIEAGNPGPARLSLYSVEGQLLYTGPMEGSSLELDLGHLDSGIYFLLWKNGHTILKRRITLL